MGVYFQEEISQSFAKILVLGIIHAIVRANQPEAVAAIGKLNLKRTVGTYEVRAEVPLGWIAVDPATGPHVLTVVSGDDIVLLLPIYILARP